MLNGSSATKVIPKITYDRNDTTRLLVVQP
jgi:hypothetical protein